jgi:two-component system, OmpR family, response regulator
VQGGVGVIKTMSPVQQHSDRNYALVADSDGSVRVLLDYLFGVVCHRGVQMLSNCSDAEKLLVAGPQPEIVAVGCYGANSGHLELIRAAAALVPKPLVIAVDHDGIPKNAVAAFLAGADDVVRLPFSLKEFALRLRARLEATGKTCDFDIDGNDDWDAEAHVAHKARLTTAEAQVLRVLIRQDGRIVSRDELSRAIDNRPWDYGDRKFDVHVAKIRKKLGAMFGNRISVRTIRSTGYQLTVTESGTHPKDCNQE